MIAAPVLRANRLGGAALRLVPPRARLDRGVLQAALAGQAARAHEATPSAADDPGFTELGCNS